MHSIPDIPDTTDAALAAHLQHLLDHKTKPLGALGSLELLARRLGEIFGTAAPTLVQPQLVLFAADHGLVAQGVSAYPQEVTAQMVRNFLAGGAAANVLARQHGLALTVVDCGMAHAIDMPGQPSLAQGPRLLRRSLGPGTADASLRQAMTGEQCRLAIAQGRALLCDLPGNALLLGEMGIGNTSSASLLMARLCRLDIADCTGSGTGLDAGALAHKTRVLRAVLQRHADATAPLDALAALGGFEIATMVGAVLQAALERRVVVVDGFIATAAVLVAHALQPRVLQCCIFAHRSGERGHAAMLAWLEAEPLLDLGLRLGEGSGAALAWPLLESACAILREMASFESAGVSGRSPAG
jgi:nicotinate-nucleotide--dimethylbenzimidazole phosphoribosyltransferase